jgi:hypothetical protein
LIQEGFYGFSLVLDKNKIENLMRQMVLNQKTHKDGTIHF